jgi:cell division septal protein FtsQ
MASRRLGQLVTPQQRTAHRRKASALPWVLALLALTASTAITMGWLSGWLPAQFVPHRLVIRGCTLTASDDVAAFISSGGHWGLISAWRCAGQAAAQGPRWVKRISVHPALNRSLVVDVEERLPLLRVVAAGKKYWLCDDLRLVPILDEDKALTAAHQLPSLLLADEPAADSFEAAATALELAGCCMATLPGQVKEMRISRSGNYSLTTTSGIQVELGGAEDMAEKIGALPKALRICEPQASHLRYLDATNPRVFYPRWDFAINTTAAEAGASAAAVGKHHDD